MAANLAYVNVLSELTRANHQAWKPVVSWMPLFSCLGASCLLTEHWATIQNQCSVELPCFEHATLRDCIRAGLLDEIRIVESVLERAAKENAVIGLLERMVVECMDMKWQWTR